MARRTVNPLTETDAETFRQVLHAHLKVGQFESIAAAVLPLFVLIQNKSPADHPLRRYSARQLRDAALCLPADVAREMTALCNVPAKVLKKNELPPVSVGDRLFKSQEDCRRFVDRVMTNPSRPRLAMEYGVPMEIIPRLFTNAVNAVAYLSKATNVNFSYGRPYWICRHGSAIAALHDNLKRRARTRPELAFVNDLVTDETLQTLRPASATWPHPPSREEVDVLTQLRNDARPKDSAQDTPVQTSLAGGTASDMMPTRTGRLPVRPRVERQVHGR